MRVQSQRIINQLNELLKDGSVGIYPNGFYEIYTPSTHHLDCHIKFNNECKPVYGFLLKSIFPK